ncbi:hypothetical protein HDU83_008554 [Entophlyctis luteolus]|nr:hypothetical protein HDU82_002947 [Entophlyctis luteolus]KAJ3351828.1 hypothetical protein HDU83_008554 [Entophlyctis luteolus]KAJ3391125.1 hypothetical protein HDU84_006492 [Entophlyctis sp. JEL0112]
MSSLLIHVVLLCYLGSLAGLLVALAFEAPKGSTYLYWVLVALNGAIALYVMAEAVCAIIVRACYPPNKQFSAPIPNVDGGEQDTNKQHVLSLAKYKNVPFEQYSSTCIIAAYLPNEKDIILETVTHFLTNVEFPCAYAIVLAYNTPQDLPVETELRALSMRSGGRFVALRVPHSTSKAENVNFALAALANKQSPTHVVSIFDADHLPYRDSICQAIATLDASQKSVCVQGRCIVRNSRESIVARLIEPEFDMIYNIFHVGFNAIHRHGLFGGSNGHWRAPVLVALLMDESMLTEDIDLAVRALSNNMHIVYDHRVRSSEEAPTTVGAYVKQRQRWAQGWFQITLHRSFWAMGTTRSFGRKLGFFFFLIFRELAYHFNAILTLQVIIGLVRAPSVNNYIWILVGTFAFLCITVLVSVQNKFNGLLFCLLYLPYSYLQMYIVLVSEIKEFLAIAKWKVTQRAPVKNTSDSPIQASL